MSKIVQLSIPMDYPGKSISKNHLWQGGNRRSGMNKEAKRWKNDLIDAFTPALREQGISNVRFVPPVHVEVTGAFWDKRNSVDLQNILELVCDAVQDAFEVNDRYFTTSTKQPTYGVLVPSITVNVSVGVEAIIEPLQTIMEVD